MTSSPPSVVFEKPWVLLAAYDVSTGETSEGYVAFNVVSRLAKHYRIVLVTRCNNRSRILADPHFASTFPGVRVIGYDLPAWARWWKRGARFYQLYAYLWQMTWPLVIKKHAMLCRGFRLVHVLNFHNDSIPSLAWKLGRPVLWGPVNHNEFAPAWRRSFWPRRVSMKHCMAFFLRRLMWSLDPFLSLHVQNCTLIFSAGSWVDLRLGLGDSGKVVRRSQLGFAPDVFSLSPLSCRNKECESVELVCAGRLDWIKGLDLAIEALALLPTHFHLRIIGTGPSGPLLRELAGKLGVGERIVFDLPVQRNELSEIYSRSDLFIFPSAEVAGLVWIEALASGLPVVAFDGATEVAAAADRLPGIHLAAVSGQRGRQIKNLAFAIEQAATSQQPRSLLRDAVLAYYDWDRLAATIQHAYESIEAIES